MGSAGKKLLLGGTGNDKRIKAAKVNSCCNRGQGKRINLNKLGGTES